MIDLNQHLVALDYVILIGYFVLMAIMTFIVSFLYKEISSDSENVGRYYFSINFHFQAFRKVSKDGTTQNMFLGGRSMNWGLIGLSLFVSNIGSEHLIGLAGSGAASGIAASAFELNALLILQLLAQVFAPVYLSSKVF